jgi:predicted alpha/beta-hydrolase family hydrolase
MTDKMCVEVAPDQEVTALVYPAANREHAGVTLILGHGAGADQRSGFMTRFATEAAAEPLSRAAKPAQHCHSRQH